MLGLLRAFSSMFKSQKTISSSRGANPAGAVPNPDEFAELSARLDVVSRLLITPTAGSVCQVALVLEDVQGRMAKLSREPGRHHPDRIRSLHGELARVRNLVEGARRVQCTQLRAVMALTQSYSAGGTVSHWQPAAPKVDLKV